LGKPAQDVTSADVDFVTDLIAQQEALADPSTFAFTEAQLGYDVTNDGIVDATDLALLQDVLAGEQTLDPLADNRFAATGVFASQLQQQQELQKQLELQQQKQLEMQQQTQTQIQQEADQARQRDLLGMLLGADDALGQRVDVKQGPVAKIGYQYDIGSGSIFGDPSRAGFYGGVSPYGPVMPFTNQPPVRRKQGGIIESNNELLRLLGEK
jgi:hypothetical protein